MQRSTDRIVTTHVGALPRTRDLEDALVDQPHRPEAFADLLPGSVGEVVEQQRDVGIDVVNDGEMGKPTWDWYVLDRLSGFEYRLDRVDKALDGQDQREFPGFYAQAAVNGLWYGTTDDLVAESASQTPVCTGPIGYDPTQVRRDVANLRNAVDGSGAVDAFLPVVAPASVEVGQQNEYYGTDEEYLWALAEALKQEYEAIVDGGFLVQVDDAWIPGLWNTYGGQIDVPTWREFCMKRVEALNHALSGIPAERVRYHVCWGSWHGPHANDIPMEELVSVMLSVNAGAYLFEAGNVRHEHEYAVWDEVALPDGKVIVPGVISHATPIVEHPRLVAQRLVRFAERVGRANVVAGTDCGLGGRVHPEIAWAKLRSLSEGARLASAQLWAAGRG